MNQSINLLFVMEVFQTSIVNFLIKVIYSLVCRLSRKFMGQTTSTKGLWRKG